jgi:plastocyanin
MIEAVNGPGAYGEPHSWSRMALTVGAGGVVAFSNPTTTYHGVQWISPPQQPSCTAGVPVGTSPTASRAEWNGTCTFTTPGTYNFRCTVHQEMTGTITVSSNGTVTTTTTGQPPSSGSGTPTTPPSGEPGPKATLAPPGSLLVGPASRALRLAFSQHGSSVRGSLAVSKGGAGGRLEVDLLARGASLARAGHSAQVAVGRLVRSSLQAGTVSFAVPLSARARRALHRHRRLALTVKIVLTGADAPALTLTRSVLLHA